jgi:hypothetical protein
MVVGDLLRGIMREGTLVIRVTVMSLRMSTSGALNTTGGETTDLQMPEVVLREESMMDIPEDKHLQPKLVALAIIMMKAGQDGVEGKNECL